MSESRLTAIELKRAKLEELRKLRLNRKLQEETSKNEKRVDRGVIDAIVEGVYAKTEPKHNYVSTAMATDDEVEVKVPDRERVRYDKATQTQDIEDGEYLYESAPIDREQLRKELEEEIRAQLINEQEKELKKRESSSTQIEVNFDEEKLLKFVGRSLKIVDKSLLADSHVLREYQNISIIDYDADSTSTDEVLSFKSSFTHDMAIDKSVTSMDWCPFNTNLLAVSYASLPPRQNMRDHLKGLILIWNIKTGVPEFVFTSTTEILVVKFALHKKTILYAGGYNGKIMQYDITTDSRLPVAQSPLSSRLDTHTHPVFAILQVDSNTQGAGNLVSCSTDGKICEWSPFVLDKPVSAPLQLKTSLSRYDEDIINSILKLSNGSLLLGGSTLTQLDNFQTRNIFKSFDPKFKKLTTGLSMTMDPITSENRILCSSIDSINLYQESGELLRSFTSSSVIMDVKWINSNIFVAASGISLELFDVTKMSKYSFHEVPTEDYINKISVNDDSLAVGTEKGLLLLYRIVV